MEDIVKKIVFLGVLLVGLINYSLGYSDIDENYWGYEAIEDLTSRELLSGYPDGTFKPDDNMTRAEFITLFMKIIEPNADVSKGTGHWAERSITLAKEKNILIEADYSEFNPDIDITRREICLMIYRSLRELKGLEIDKLKNRKKFLDISQNNLEEKITAILSHIGVLTGYPDETVRLEEFSSRAETCCFINNFIKSRIELLMLMNDSEFVVYDNDIASIDIFDLPCSLKKWRYSEDTPYLTTKIKNISLFEFLNPIDKYKAIFDEINESENIYLEYRKKFGEGNYVIAVEFETTNNTNEYEAYAGSEFLHISFPEEDILVVDKFDTDEIHRQLNKNASIGQVILPGETLDTSAFYVVDILPKSEIRFDRIITDLYNISKSKNENLSSLHSLVIKLGSR